MKAIILLISGLIGGSALTTLAENLPTLGIVHAEVAPSLIANFSLEGSAGHPVSENVRLEGKWKGRLWRTHLIEMTIFRLPNGRLQGEWHDTFWDDHAGKNGRHSLSPDVDGTQFRFFFNAEDAGGVYNYEGNIDDGSRTISGALTFPNGRRVPLSFVCLGNMAQAGSTPKPASFLDDVTHAIDVQIADRFSAGRMFTVMEDAELKQAVSQTDGASGGNDDFTKHDTVERCKRAGINYILLTTLEEFQDQDVDLARGTTQYQNTRSQANSAANLGAGGRNSASPAILSGLEGRWEGDHPWTKIPRRVAVTFTRSSDGSLQAEWRNLTIYYLTSSRSVSIDGNSIKVVFNDHEKIDGNIDYAMKRISGMWTSSKGGRPSRFQFDYVDTSDTSIQTVNNVNSASVHTYSSSVVAGQMSSALKREQIIRLTVRCRLVDCSSGELLDSATHNYSGNRIYSVVAQGNNDVATSDYIQAAARDIADWAEIRVGDAAFPIKVLDLTGGDVLINRGLETGWKAGQTFEIFALGKEVKDPQTGEVLGRDETTVGRAVISELHPKFSKAQILDNNGIVIGAICRRVGGK